MSTTEEKPTKTNPFEKFQSHDSNTKIFTEENGRVIKLVKGFTRPQYSSIIKAKDFYVYNFKCPEKYILIKLKSTPNAVALNKAFGEVFEPKDIFVVEITKGKATIASYAIQKNTLITKGKERKFPGYEHQIVCSLEFWEKLS